MARKQHLLLDGWDFASTLLLKYLQVPSKIDSLFNDLPEDISSNTRRSCQFLFFGVIRHKRLLEESLMGLMKKKPDLRVFVILLLAAFEILESPEERMPKVVDFAVSKAKRLSRQEGGFVNAILRKIGGVLKGKREIGVRYSHPDWLVEGWIEEFGMENAVALLEWDQRVPKNYLRSGVEQPLLGGAVWPNFYEIRDWGLALGLVAEGKGYIQDPSTRIAPNLAPIGVSDAVLDLAAAPGGKSLQLAERLGLEGLLVAVDLPGPRMKNLYENLSKISNVGHGIVESDILDLSSGVFCSLGLPVVYNVVLLDAPCSNTGVIQRRPDVKWRLKAEDIGKMAEVQLKLLLKAGEFVGSLGFLVYSTCSIERRENEGVVEGFLRENREFRLVESVLSFPWESGHDGGGAFLFQKTI